MSGVELILVINKYMYVYCMWVVALDRFIKKGEEGKDRIELVWVERKGKEVCGY